jgi:hypothetical protein
MPIVSQWKKCMEQEWTTASLTKNSTARHCVHLILIKNSFHMCVVHNNITTDVRIIATCHIYIHTHTHTVYIKKLHRYKITILTDKYLIHCMLSQHLTHFLLLIDNMYGLQSLEAEEYVKDSAINSTKSASILESASQLHIYYIRWQWGCQPHMPTALYPQEDSWYSFLLEAESTPGP